MKWSSTGSSTSLRVSSALRVPRAFSFLASIIILLLMVSPVLGWNPLSVSGKCLTNGQVNWTIQASQKEDDNLIEVSINSLFTSPTSLTLDSNLKASIVNSATKIWARWASDHTVVTAGAVDKCNVPTPTPNHPKTTPPATDTIETITANDVAQTYMNNLGFVGLFGIIAIVAIFFVYMYFLNQRNKR